MRCGAVAQLSHACDQVRRLGENLSPGVGGGHFLCAGVMYLTTYVVCVWGGWGGWGEGGEAFDEFMKMWVLVIRSNKIIVHCSNNK